MSLQWDNIIHGFYYRVRKNTSVEKTMGSTSSAAVISWTIGHVRLPEGTVIELLGAFGLITRWCVLPFKLQLLPFTSYKAVITI
jgi:hypothetical protein